jgi:hypothetical protein
VLHHSDTWQVSCLTQCFANRQADMVQDESDAQAGLAPNSELNADETPDAAATRDKLNQALIQV